MTGSKVHLVCICAVVKRIWNWKQKLATKLKEREKNWKRNWKKANFGIRIWNHFRSNDDKHDVGCGDVCRVRCGLSGVPTHVAARAIAPALIVPVWFPAPNGRGVCVPKLHNTSGSLHTTSNSPLPSLLLKGKRRIVVSHNGYQRPSYIKAYA